MNPQMLDKVMKDEHTLTDRQTDRQTDRHIFLFAGIQCCRLLEGLYRLYSVRSFRCMRRNYLCG